MKIAFIIGLLLLSGCGISAKDRIKILVETAKATCQAGTETYTIRSDGVVEITCKLKSQQPL